MRLWRKPDGLLRESEAPVGDAVREVDGQHGVEAVVCGPLEQLHDIGDPEDSGERAEKTGIAG